MDGRREAESSFRGVQQMNSTFSMAANSLSHFYASAQDQQIKAFRAGERSALGKLRKWISERQQGSQVTEADIIAYLKSELGYDGEGASGVLTQSQQPYSGVNMQTPLVTIPGGAQPTNNVMFAATQRSSLTETPHRLGIHPGGYYFHGGSQSLRSAINEVNTGHTLSPRYTFQLENQDVEMDMNAASSSQQFRQ